MNYGMPTLIELPDMEDCAALCKELELQFIEFNMNLPQYQPDTLDEAKLERIARESGARRVTLMVSDFNEGGQRFYRRMGYWTLGEIPDATRTGIGEIVMMKDLD